MLLIDSNKNYNNKNTKNGLKHKLLGRLTEEEINNA